MAKKAPKKKESETPAASKEEAAPKKEEKKAAPQAKGEPEKKPEAEAQKAAEKEPPKTAPVKEENAIFFATGNEKKLEEIGQILGKTFAIKSFRDLDKKPEVEETEDTLEGNAILKAKAYFEIVGIPTFADDTGLEINALGGKPGVLSARYAGPENDAEKNMAKAMEELRSATDRSAKFRTVIAYYDGKTTQTFAGELKGEISIIKAGTNGFGYDPIFLPEKSDLTLGEMKPEEKNKISHRARALAKFVKFLK